MKGLAAVETGAGGGRGSWQQCFLHPFQPNKVTGDLASCGDAVPRQLCRGNGNWLCSRLVLI